MPSVPSPSEECIEATETVLVHLLGFRGIILGIGELVAAKSPGHEGNWKLIWVLLFVLFTFAFLLLTGVFNAYWHSVITPILHNSIIPNVAIE